MQIREASAWRGVRSNWLTGRGPAIIVVPFLLVGCGAPSLSGSGPTATATSPTVSATPSSPVATTPPTSASGSPTSPPAVTPAGPEPPGRSQSGFAYDGINNEMLLFGGLVTNYATATSTFMGDTWEWNGAGWSQRHPAHSPSARDEPAMIWDPDHHEVLLFGGYDAASQLCCGNRETWIWDGNDWTQLHPAHEPAVSETPFLARDDATGQLLLIGVWTSGATGPSQAETWSWSGTDWIDLPNPGMPGDNQLQMAFDPSSSKLLMSGAGAAPATGGPPTVWQWTAALWQPLSDPGPINLWNLVTNYRDDYVLGVTSFLGTWELPPTTWARVHSDDDTNVTAGASFAWDPQLSEVVEYGVTHDGKTYTSEVFGWNGSAWVRITA